MENSEEQHDGIDALEKTKSSDSHGLHEEKSEVSIRRRRRGGDKFSVRSQAGTTEVESFIYGQSSSRSRRSTRARRSILSNVFRSVVKRHRGLSSVSRSSTDGFDSRTGKVSDLNGSKSISSVCDSTNTISNPLENVLILHQAKRRKSSDAQEVSSFCDDSDIPRRLSYVPRESSLDTTRVPDLSNSAGNGNSAARSDKLSSDLDTPTRPVGISVGEHRRINGECRENIATEWNSGQHCKQINGLVRRREQGKNRKSQSKATENEKHVLSKRLLYANSGKFGGNYLVDDEESLEQNAARMLSSRFDPRFTGLSGNKTRISSKSLSRVLRPRKQSDKGYVKKRRHFYEVCLRDVDPYWVLKRRIRVFWPLDQSWYFGFVDDYDPVTKLHHVKYDDRDEEWTNLEEERFKLLLLPSEFSHKFDSTEMKLEEKSRKKDVTTSADDQCMDGILESETIISWLARSAHRGKASSLKILKEKRVSHTGCVPNKTSRKPPSLVLSRKCEDEKDAKVPCVKTRDHYDDKRFAFVYSRRRFHKKVIALEYDLEQTSSWNLPNSFKVSDCSIDDFEACKQSGSIFGALSPNKGMLRLLFPFPCISNLSWLFDDSWLHTSISLLLNGKLIPAQPVVYMEVIFLDNKMGLRFLSFNGHLQDAVAVICLFMKNFHQSKVSNHFNGLQLPFTSIGFRLSCSEVEGQQLLFYVYNFLDMWSSRWLHLGRKLKHLSVSMKELPLSECTYYNVKNMLCSSEKNPLSSDHCKPFTLETFRRMSWKRFIHYLDPEKSGNSPTRLPYFRLNGQKRSYPFSLPYCSAPSLFLFLQLRLLMEKNLDYLTLEIPSSLNIIDCCPENYEKFTDKCSSPMEDSSDQFSETTHENLGSTLNCAVANCELLCCNPSKSERDTLSLSYDGELNRDGSSVAVQKELGENICDETESQFHKYHFTKSWENIGKTCSPLLEDISSTEESEGGCGSCLNTIDVKIQMNASDTIISHNQAHNSRKTASYLTWTTNDYTIPSPSTTAPRTMWHHSSRQSSISASAVHQSKLWPGDWDRFVNDYKKPRSQVSYALPFRGYDMHSKSQTRHRKERSNRRQKADNAKNVLADYKRMDNDPDSLTCDANVLVTVGDRGWRTYGALVSLEFDDLKDWQIAVKLSGSIKYSHKPQQFLQPGITNRYTHSMMWRGGKDWALEFTDRSQWSLFKDMYGECHNRNVRAASVKNIPIPGVRLIEDCDDYDSDIPFIHNCAKYIRQKGTEVDIALDQSHVLYDMDSEDEEWISNLRISADGNGRMLHEISEEIFEKIMDMFEKAAFTQCCNEFTDDYITSFMADIGPIEVTKAVHQLWHRKRQKKGVPLIRQFQPPLWEQYQRQLKEWESTMANTQISSNGCHDKASFTEKPSMFAFCLRPRGLEVPNKGSKQRSHKKLPLNAHYSHTARESHGLQGKKLNGYLLGKEKVTANVSYCEYSDISLRSRSPTAFSPRDLAPGFSASDSGWSDRNDHWRLDRNISKKMRMSVSPKMPVSPRDHPKMSIFAQRTKGDGNCRPNTGLPERFNRMPYRPDGLRRRQADVDEFMLRDASNAAQHASNMAKLKREKAQWLMHKADLAVHKAAVALMTADAIKAFENDIMGDFSRKPNVLWSNDDEDREHLGTPHLDYLD